MKKVFVVVPLLLVWLILGAENTLACSCIAPDPDKSLTQQVRDAVKDSDIVFSARVLSITELPEEGHNKIKLRLTKTWKGRLTRTVTVTTGLGSGDCGYRFEKGKTYLIYAYRSEKKRFSTNSCSRTAAVGSNKDLDVLKRLMKKR